MSRRLRAHVCRLLLAALLFAQWAVNAHACTGPDAMRGAEVAVAQDIACDDMAGMAKPDASVPCAAHCQQAGQSTDRAPAPTLAPALLTSFFALPAAPARALPGDASAAPPAPRVAASPPLAILHCCFRI